MNHKQMVFVPRIKGLHNIQKSLNVIHNINRKNMIILIDTKKAFDKIQNLFMTKSSNQKQEETFST